MSSFSSTSFPYPKNWQDFERYSKVLFECILEDPNCQLHGRGGQKQDGVDIYGRRKSDRNQLVGIQCKGKDGEYGEAVTEKELRREFDKSRKFKPNLDEFILITTAPDDVKIQESARLLEEEIVKSGYVVSISVIGWGQLVQHISRYPKAIRTFHPDATPFTDEILDSNLVISGELGDLKKQVSQLVAMVSARGVINYDPNGTRNPNEKYLDEEIDKYRDLIQERKPRTALTLLRSLKERRWLEASDRIKFRISSNIGAAQHNIGEYQEAAAAFMEASTYEANRDVAVANKIIGLLIGGDKLGAAVEAALGVARFPESATVAVQRIQARSAGETVDAAWAAIPPVARANPDVLAMRLMMLREEGGFAWQDESLEAAKLHPTHKLLQRLAAEAALTEFLSVDAGLIGAGGAHRTSEERLLDAAATLKQVWEASSTTEERPDAQAAHNGALALLILRKETEAAALADDALKLGVATQETKKLRAMLYLREGKTKEALALLEQIPADVEQTLIVAEAILDADPQRARSLVTPFFDERYSERHRIGAAEIIVESFTAERDWRAALEVAQQLAVALPQHPSGPLLKYRTLVAKGDAGAVVALKEAVRLLGPKSSFASRFLIAVALHRADLNDSAAGVLEGAVDETRDSPALRLFLASALASDRRATVARVLAGLSRHILEIPYFQRIGIGLALRAGDMHAAEQTLRAYLLLRPRDLGMQLKLLHALLRKGDLDTLRKELDRSIAEFDGTAEEWLQLAHAIDLYGDWEKGHALAYATWLKHQSDPAVNLRYVGLFLQPGHSTAMPIILDAVCVDSAFGLYSNSEHQKFIIESNPALRLLPNTVAPGHPVAVATMGKRAGDQIVIGDTEYTIEWIKPKQLDALHHILDTFNLFFPGTEGLRRVTLKDTDGPGAFAPIFETAKERHEQIEAAFNLYEKSHLPIAMIAHCLGSEPVATFLGLVEGGRTIRVCDGNKEEREEAINSVKGNGGKGCIVDDITLHIIRRLVLEDVVQQLCGPIGIVDHTLGRLQQQHYELSAKANEPDLSIGWLNGQAYRTEVSVAQKKEAILQLEADITWTRAHAATLSAQGLADMPVELRDLFGKYQTGFSDEFLAAQSHDRILLSEDHVHRALGIKAFNLRATWLQPLLIVALREQKITRARYNKAILAMLKYQASFISIDKDVLVDALGLPSSVPLPKDYLIACDALGGPKAELSSHIHVTLEALALIWDKDSHTSVVQGAATGTLLWALLRNHWDKADSILGYIRRRAETEFRRGWDFTAYVDAWIRGHFLVR